MTEQIPDEYLSNFEQFRDIFSSLLVEKLATSSSSSKSSAKAKRRSKKSSSPIHKSSQPPAGDEDDDDHIDPEDLSEFTTYLATSTFLCLPNPLQTLSHRSPPETLDLYSLPLSQETVASLLTTLDPSIIDSLSTYLPSSPSSRDSLSPDSLFNSLLTSYISLLTTPPPPPASTKGQVTACEICQRDHINLTYHHLIPRSTHAKVVKRKWHPKEDLQNVAWLCGACHRFVHRFRPNEELAKEFSPSSGCSLKMR